jgi:hypothetical protein
MLRGALVCANRIVRGCLSGGDVGRRDLGTGNRLSDQPLDRGNRFVVRGGDDRDRNPAAACAAGTADAMDVVVRVMGNVKIEDVADFGNIEAARSDVGGNQLRQFALAELIERRGSG